MKQRAQTATEYLVILAVVIVIALIVVGVMGGIPSLGGGASASAAKAALASESIGVTQYTVGLNYVQLRLQNNLLSTISITNISANNRNCYLDKTPITIRTGSSEIVYCFNVYETESGFRYDYPLSITYTDTKTDAQYVLNYGANLVGTSAETQPAVTITTDPSSWNWFSVIRGNYTLGDIDLDYFEASTNIFPGGRRDQIYADPNNNDPDDALTSLYYFYNSWLKQGEPSTTNFENASIITYFVLKRYSSSDKTDWLVPSNVRFYGSTNSSASKPWSE